MDLVEFVLTTIIIRILTSLTTSLSNLLEMFSKIIFSEKGNRL